MTVVYAEFAKSKRHHAATARRSVARPATAPPFSASGARPTSACSAGGGNSPGRRPGRGGRAPPIGDADLVPRAHRMAGLTVEREEDPVVRVPERDVDHDGVAQDERSMRERVRADRVQD